MSAASTLPPVWLLHSALGGGLLLLVAWCVMKRSGAPARRHFLGALGVTAALVAALLCLGPRWLVLPVDVPFLTSPANALATSVDAEAGGDVHDLEAVVSPEETVADGVQAAAVAEPAGFSFAALLAELPLWLAAGWCLGAVVFLGRWLIGHVMLARLLRTGCLAPPRVARLFAAMTADARTAPRLLISPYVRVPLSCGLLKPTVVLPPDLCDAAEGVLRWVFAHELTHLERRDAWTAFLFGLAQAIYFYLPWYWWLRRQVRLCQEYIADAAAARQAGSAEDYAQFLLSLTRKPAVPLGATGVTGNTSDLYRRVAMLLESPGSVEKRCGWLWSLAATGGLLALAVFVSGIGLRADAADEEKDVVIPLHVLDQIGDAEVVFVTDGDGDKKVYVITSKDGKVQTRLLADDVKADPKKAGQAGSQPKVVLPDVEEIIKKLPQGLSEEQLKQIRDQMKRAHEEINKANDNIRKATDQLHRVYPHYGSLKHGESEVKKAIDDLKAHIAKDVKSDVRKAELEKALESYRKVLEEQGNKVRVWDVKGGTAVSGLQGRLSALAGSGQGRLGLRVDKPSDALAEQLDLAKGQGLVITDVVADSAAAKAGFKPNDILLEFAGKKVPNDAEALIGMVNELKANSPVDALVLRKGKKETVKGIAVGESARRGSLQLQGPAKLEVKPRIAVTFQPKARIEVQPAAGGKSVMMSINRTNDNFTAKHQEDNVTVSVTGTVEGGKAKASAIEVQEGGKTTKFDSVDKVPEQHRDRVKKLIESVGKGGAQIEIKTPATRFVPAVPALPPLPATLPTPAKPQPPKKPAGRDVLLELPDSTLRFPAPLTTLRSGLPTGAVLSPLYVDPTGAVSRPLFVDPTGALNVEGAARFHLPLHFRVPDAPPKK